MTSQPLHIRSVKRRTLTLSFDVVVIVDGDGDGDGDVDDGSACQVQLLHVYRCAIEFLALTAAAAEEIPRGNAALLDQFDRIVGMLTRLCR